MKIDEYTIMVRSAEANLDGLAYLFGPKHMEYRTWDGKWKLET